MNLTLRPASLDDLALLKRWDEQPHVREAGVAGLDWETEHLLHAFSA
ncbi:MAG: hypothetical protein ACFCUG_09035 [Thiotrichales bacterium]